jgi:hypothetical protein
MPSEAAYAFGEVVLVPFPLLEQSLVIRSMGQFSPRDQQALRQMLAQILG